MKNILLSVVVPCFNEELRFRDGFNHYYSYLKKQNYNWELIFVNDGSGDKTKLLLERSANVHRNIKSISYKENKGKGFAIVKGIEKAKGKYILFSDLDHSVPIATVGKFLRYFEQGFQVIIASRRVKGSRILIHQNLIRELLGRGFSFLTKFVIDSKITDATCGFKAFEKSVAKKISSKISIYDWAFDAEILFLCKKYNIKIFHAPVIWSNVGGSKVSISKDIFRSFISLLTIRLNDLQNKY